METERVPSPKTRTKINHADGKGVVVGGGAGLLFDAIDCSHYGGRGGGGVLSLEKADTYR